MKPQISNFISEFFRELLRMVVGFFHSSWFLFIIMLVLCAGMMKLGPYLGYHLFYKPYVEKEVAPLKERIKALENTLNSKTNGPIQLQ